MDETTVEKIFRNLTDRYGIIPEDVKRIISVLIRVTLKFRDMLVEQKEEPLTVEETQKALDILLGILQNKKLPAELPGRISSLVQLWVDEIRLHTLH